MREAILSASALALALASCGGDELLVLGEREPPRYLFDEPRLIEELAAPSKTDNPSLTADLLELYFTSERTAVPAEIFVAKRARRDAPFGEPELVVELNAPGVETSPAVSADGLSIWLASDRAGGLGDLDIWRATRAARDARWGAPEHVAELSSPYKDIPRPLGQRGAIMPLASDRASPGSYQVFFAARAGDPATFRAPELRDELSAPPASTVDGFLTDDGLTLFYVTGPAIGPADLFVAWRRSTSEPFGHHTALRELNTERDERDPWLSPDGSELYFASDRGGTYAIYVAAARRVPALTDAGP